MQVFVIINIVGRKINVDVNVGEECSENIDENEMISATMEVYPIFLEYTFYCFRCSF